MVTEDRENGDGHDPSVVALNRQFTGAVLRTADVAKERGDGIFTRGDPNSHQGVLQRAMTAATNVADQLHQELKTAYWKNEDQRNRFIAALTERERYGCSIEPLLHWLIANNAGTNGARLEAIIRGLTHTTFTTNYKPEQAKRSWLSGKPKPGAFSR